MCIPQKKEAQNKLEWEKSKSKKGVPRFPHCDSQLTVCQQRSNPCSSATSVPLAIMLRRPLHRITHMRTHTI